MRSETGQKSFDVMKWLRETRDRIHEETKDMTFEERRRWSEERRSGDPWLSDWWNGMRTPESVDDVAEPARAALGGSGAAGTTRDDGRGAGSVE